MSLRNEIFAGANKYYKKMNNIILPMNQFFGIVDLVYIEVSNDNSLINLTTNINWIEHCVEKEYFLDDPQMVSPNNIGNGYAMWSVDWEPHYKSEAYENGMLKDASEYGIGKGVTYINKNKNGYKAYVFSGPKNNIDLHTKLYSNMPLIKKFVTFFDEEIKDIRKKMMDSRVNLVKLKGDAYFQQQGLIIPQENDKLHQCNFLHQLGILDSSISDVNLTKRELQCINLYLEGNSAQKTSVILSISRRTVESHIDSIKNKLQLNYKRELFDKIRVLKELEII